MPHTNLRGYYYVCTRCKKRWWVTQRTGDYPKRGVWLDPEGVMNTALKKMNIGMADWQGFSCPCNRVRPLHFYAWLRDNYPDVTLEAWQAEWVEQRLSDKRYTEPWWGYYDERERIGLIWQEYEKYKETIHG